ncbi:gonadotropin-releasing hormone receptor-like [Paramacrobiotus metropolitanus]|uniref:gonadotropin-releasing hormone receptor-like n=1 Tax=Paramacrobiotus metropolitanus TaxID=2943436 RepID=UPI002445F632|nr:gonadotropin-releasing hormone receptor-like [Paramacrobiotus metropolitanus]XP_055333880.1 gonadotropin-releasing hormone receptor-like [Paramacrobiotus metropolitanus]
MSLTGANLTQLFNFTLPPDMRFNEGHRVQMIGYGILMSISSLFNLTVFFLLCQRPRPMSRTTILLISLTVSDLLVTFLTMPLEIAWAYTVQWLASEGVCKVMMMARIFGLYSSSFNLVAISIDRFCIIMYPFTTMTSANDRVKSMVAAVWVLSAVCSLPQAIVFRKLYHPFFTTFAQCATFGAFPTPELELLYNVFVTLMLFVIPLLLFIVFYGRLWFYIRGRHLMTSRPDTRSHNGSGGGAGEQHCSTGYSAVPLSASALTVPDMHCPTPPPGQAVGNARRHKWRSRKDPSFDNAMVDYNLGQSMRYGNAPNIYMRAKSKSFKMAITLVIVFLVCWVPYYLVSCWYWFDKDSLISLDPRIQRALFIFAVSQSCLNPIVTGIFSLRLDRHLTVLSCCRKTLGTHRRTPLNDNRNGNNINLPTPAGWIHTNNRLSVRRPIS